MQSCNQTVGRSPVLRGSGDFFCFPMDQAEINNWKSIAESMEAKGDIESWFTFVPVQLLMGSLIPCQTSQSCWLTLLDLLENRDEVGNRA